MTGPRPKIYVASKTRHAPMWLALRAAGVPIISTWIDEAGAGESPSLSDLWIRCVREASSATALIVFAEAGDVLKGGFVEVGAALGCGVPVFAVGAQPGWSFVNHPLVMQCKTVVDAVYATHSPVPLPPEDWRPVADAEGSHTGESSRAPQASDLVAGRYRLEKRLSAEPVHAAEQYRCTYTSDGERCLGYKGHTEGEHVWPAGFRRTKPAPVEEYADKRDASRPELHTFFRTRSVGVIQNGQIIGVAKELYNQAFLAGWRARGES